MKKRYNLFFYINNGSLPKYLYKNIDSYFIESLKKFKLLELILWKN